MIVKILIYLLLMKNMTNEYIDEILDYRPLNIYDPAQCKNIDLKLRDLLVEKDLIRHNDSEFPKDRNSRHFSTIYYTRTLPNGEKHDRKWLVYSNELDSVFCFCCKLFNSESYTNQLANQGTNDLRNLTGKIKRHETSSILLI